MIQAIEMPLSLGFAGAMSEPRFVSVAIDQCMQTRYKSEFPGSSPPSNSTWSRHVGPSVTIVDVRFHMQAPQCENAASAIAKER